MIEDFKKFFSYNLNRVISEKNFSIDDILEKTGISEKIFSRYLLGDKYPTEKNFFLILDALKISEEEFSKKIFSGNTWSVSRVNTWVSNPWDFHCKYRLGLRKKSFYQDSLDRGTVVHAILEYVGKGMDFESAKNFFETTDKFNEVSDKGLLNGYRVAHKYLSFYGGINSNGKILEQEKNILWDLDDILPNQKFTGYIDAVVEDDRGKIWLVDYKSYSNKPKYDDLELEFQANVYMYVMKNIYHVDIAGFVYDCFNPKEKIVGRGYHFAKFKIPYNEETVNKVTEQFLQTIKIILENPDYTRFLPNDYGSVYHEEYLYGFQERSLWDMVDIEDKE